MKKRRRVGLWLVLLLLLAVIGLLLWQRGNIEAAIKGLQYTPEEIEENLSENSAAVRDKVQKDADITMRDLTEEEKRAWKNKTISEEELIERLTASDPEKQKDDVSEEVLKYRRDLSALIARVYIMQAEYNAALNDMFEQAKREYAGKSKEERTKKALVQWGLSYIGRATQLEKKCDDEMDSLVAQIEVLIAENNGDASIVDQIIETYANEKNLKKSWYLSEMQKGGILN